MMLHKLRKATDTLTEVFIYYAVLLIVSSTVFAYAENKSIAESLYWAGVTSTTIGYGDISPITLIGRIDALVTAAISVFFLVPLIVVRLVEMLYINRDAWTHEEQENIKELIKTLDRKIDECLRK